MNNVVTASRMGCFLRCPRAHYWQCEIGLSKESNSMALWVGSAWHRAMEARWKGKEYKECLREALNVDGETCDPYIAATVAGLLAAYFQIYGKSELVGVKMLVEKEFDFPLFGSKSFRSRGKIDRLGEKASGENVLVDYKTTGESVAPDSNYWMRLKFNAQLLQYVTAANNLGYEVHEVIYDVVRKPSIKPKNIVDKDKKGRKIVVDKDGKRVWKNKAKGIPQESASDKNGWITKEHLETPEEYYERLYKDCMSRPEFYFFRREVPIFQADINEFKAQRLTIVRQIEFLRATEAKMARPEHAWARVVSEDNCKFCVYNSFCLQNTSIDINNPPEGFSIKGFNLELNEQDASTTKDIENSASAV